MKAILLAGGELDRAARTERVRLDDIADTDAEVRAVAEDFLDAPGLIVEAEHDLVDLGDLPDKVNLVPKKWPIEYRDDGFWGVERERPEPRAFSPGEQNGLHDKRQS